MEYNHRKKVRHFCHYCMLAGPYKGGGVMASNPPEIFRKNLHCKEIMQCDMRALAPSGAWPEAFELPGNAA